MTSVLPPPPPPPESQECLIAPPQVEHPCVSSLIAPPQVCKAYDGRLLDTKAEPGGTSMQSEMASQAHRMHMRVKRKCQADGAPSWRPEKRFRASSRSWLLNLDNHVKLSLGLSGLVSFVPDPSGSDGWSDWRTMRHLLISADQGGDGLCGASFLRAIGANISVIVDWSHCSNNDFHDALRDLGLFRFWLLVMILLHVEHGPRSDDMRWS